jgi:hypothetical protein
MLVLLMRDTTLIVQVAWYIYIRFLAVSLGSELVLRLLPQQFGNLEFWCSWSEGYMNYAVNIAAEGVMCILCFVTVGSGIHVLLGRYLNIFRGCSVSAADNNKYLLSTSLRWAQMSWYTYIQSFTTIGSSVQVVLSLLSLQFESLQACYYWWKRFMKWLLGPMWHNTLWDVDITTCWTVL